MKDLVIIGSGPAGLSACVYAKRAMLDVLVIEKAPLSGGQIVYTKKVDNYPGLLGISGFELGMKFREHANELGVEFQNGTVTAIEDRKEFKEVILNTGDRIEAKAVLVSTGAKHRELNVPGEKKKVGTGVSYCATCDGVFFKDKEVAVAGGGEVALGNAIYLSNICRRVYIIHRRDDFRAAKITVNKVKEAKNIEILPYRQVKEILGEPGRLVIKLDNIKNNNEEELKVSGIFVAVGMVPDTEFLKDVVKLDSKGYVIAGEDCKTNTPGIFAAGDVRTKKVRQVVTAVSDGAVAVASIREYLTKEFQ